MQGYIHTSMLCYDISHRIVLSCLVGSLLVTTVNIVVYDLSSLFLFFIVVVIIILSFSFLSLVIYLFISFILLFYLFIYFFFIVNIVLALTTFPI